MAAKTKIAKNEQMAASLSSENSKLECEVQIGAHKERISVLEAELTAVKHSHPSLSTDQESRSPQQREYVASIEKELFMAREQLSKYKGLRRTHMARDDDRIVGVIDPQGTTSVIPHGSSGEVSSSCSCDACKSVEEEEEEEAKGNEGNKKDSVTVTACARSC